MNYPNDKPNNRFKQMLDDLYNGDLDIKRLNYGIITLVPKTKEVNQIQKFSPICLLNVSFKIFTKVLMNKLNLVVDFVISPVQTAFIKGRYIMEGVLVLHEALNSVHVKNRVPCCWKWILKKPMIKSNDLLFFRCWGGKDSPVWIDWVMGTIRGGKVCIKVDENYGPYFPTHKGLRQGDSLSSLIFWFGC